MLCFFLPMLAAAYVDEATEGGSIFVSSDWVKFEFCSALP
jgi:hypothetical protein